MTSRMSYVEKDGGVCGGGIQSRVEWMARLVCLARNVGDDVCARTDWR